MRGCQGLAGILQGGLRGIQRGGHLLPQLHSAASVGAEDFPHQDDPEDKRDGKEQADVAEQLEHGQAAGDAGEPGASSRMTDIMPSAAPSRPSMTSPRSELVTYGD